MVFLIAYAVYAVNELVDFTLYLLRTYNDMLDGEYDDELLIIFKHVIDIVFLTPILFSYLIALLPERGFTFVMIFFWIFEFGSNYFSYFYRDRGDRDPDFDPDSHYYYLGYLIFHTLTPIVVLLLLTP